MFKVLVNCLISFPLAMGIVFSSAGCMTEAGEVPADPKAVENIVEEISVDYGTYGEDAKDRIDELLKELSSADKSAGIRWTQIMDLWMSPRLGHPIHYNVLPDGLPDTEELCIVVLGFQLNPDGTMKDELIERLKVALNSANKYPHAYIVCTGGGTAAENESASEASEMAEWLMAHGIGDERIIVEDNSTTTSQNAIFTYDILTSLYPSVKKLAIISSDYHIATGELLFEAEAILRANAPGNEKLEVISNAAWSAPSGSLSSMFQAGALIELSGDVETAFDIYYENYDIHELPARYYFSAQSYLIDLFQFLIGKAGVFDSLDIVCDLLRSGSPDQNTCDDPIPEDPRQRHLSKGLAPVLRYLVQGADLFQPARAQSTLLEKPSIRPDPAVLRDPIQIAVCQHPLCQW